MAILLFKMILCRPCAARREVKPQYALHGVNPFAGVTDICVLLSEVRALLLEAHFISHAIHMVVVEMALSHPLTAEAHEPNWTIKEFRGFFSGGKVRKYEPRSCQ